MRAFCETLSEKDRRRFAALEAARLGHGGIEYVADVLGCSTRTIERGATNSTSCPTTGRGAGAAFRWRSKKKIAAEPELKRNLKAVLEVRTAGDPDEEHVRVDRSLAAPDRREGRREGNAGQSACRARLDGRAGLAPHKIARTWPAVNRPTETPQFQRIAALKAEYLARATPYSPSIRRRKSISGNSIARAGCGRGRRFGLRSRLPQLGHRRGHPARDLRPGTQLRPHQCGPEPRHQPVRLRQLALVLEPHRPALLPRRDIRSCCCATAVAAMPRVAVPLQAGPARPGRRNWGSRFAWRTTRATARSTTRSNAVSSRTSRGPARACCSTRWTRSSA